VKRFDLLKRVELTDIESIHMDSDEDSVTATFRLPVGVDGETAEYVEVIQFGRNTPDRLRHAAKELAEALLDYVRTRQVNVGESPCVTCTGACCGRVYSEVHVTVKDLERMGPELTERGVARYKDGETSWTGYTGVLRRKVWVGEGVASVEGEDPQMACMFLDPGTSTCTIYDRRPDVCRNYTGYGCGEYEEASGHLVTLRRKVLGV
jgi:Fe-S-cluster containining protein